MEGKPYRDYAQLVLSARRDVDYRLEVTDRSAEITVTAIHAGTISPPTGELAAAIAGEEHNLYLLRGLRAATSPALRIAVSRFEEAHLRSLVRRSRVALALVAASGDEERVHLGGSCRGLRAMLAEELASAGVAVVAPSGGAAAHHPDRFYNAATEGGVLLELSGGLCRALRAAPAGRHPRWTALVGAARRALARYQSEVRGDLARAITRYEEITESVLRAVRAGDNHRGSTR